MNRKQQVEDLVAEIMDEQRERGLTTPQRIEETCMEAVHILLTTRPNTPRLELYEEAVTQVIARIPGAQTPSA